MLFSINTHLPPEVVDHYSHPKEIKKATTLNDTKTRSRSSYIAWEPSSNWLASLVETYMRNMNTMFFHYDLTNMAESHCQYTVYNKGDYYHWHLDSDINFIYSNEAPPVFPDHPAGPNTHLLQKEYHIRKLSFTLQLSHPEEYTGGELQFNMGEQLVTIPKGYGMLTVFDSRISHRVRKVKSGQRKSFVGWMCGPRWR